MPNYCTVTIMGHLGQNPELRTLESGTQVCNASIAYTPFGDGKPTIWFTLTVWGKQAERFEKWFKKGDLVLAEGELDQQKWTGKDGEEKSKLVIRVTGFSGTGKGKEKDEGEAQAPRKSKTKAQPEDDGDVPF